MQKKSDSNPQCIPVEAAQGLSPLAKTLVLLPSLLIAGSLGAQVNEVSQEGNPTPAKPSPASSTNEVLELPKVEIQGESQPKLSSPKFTQPLLDTPQTVVVVPKEIFNQQGANTLSDVLRNTPGITFTAGENGNVASGDTFTMRGFDTSGSIFVDGVRDTGAYSRDVFNLEQVEIAKGPAGADNGRGGSSGYVNLATKTPRQENFTTASLSYGLADGDGTPQRRAAIDTNLALDKSPVAGTAFRLNLFGQNSGTPGRDYVEQKSWGVAPSLALGLGTPTRLILSASYVKQDNRPDSGLPAVAFPDNPFNTAPVTGSVNQSNFYGLKDDYEDVKNLGLTARLEHDITPDSRISNQTRYTKTEREALTTYINSSATTATAPALPPYNPATGQIAPRRYVSETDNKIISNQTNYTIRFDTGPLTHDLSAGLDVSNEKQVSPVWQTVSASGTASGSNLIDPNLYTDIYHPNPNRSVVRPGRISNGAFASAEIDTVAVYLFDTIHITERFLLNGSIRAERYWTKYASLAAPTAAVPAPTVSRIRASDDLYTWKVGAAYKPLPNGTVYAAYGTSQTPPGTSFTLSNTAGNANNPNTDPQEGRNYEIGTKWEFLNSRLSTSLALFRSENTNVATNVGGVPPVITYDAEQIVQGIELGISGKLTKEWLVFGGFTWLDSENKTSSAVAPGASSGADLRFTPKYSANLWTTYALPFHVTIGGGVQYSESTARSTSTTAVPTATTLTEVPSYWLFNALIAYEVNKNFTVRLNVNNLFDEDYYRINNGGARYYPGASRNYVLTADLKF